MSIRKLKLAEGAPLPESAANSPVGLISRCVTVASQSDASGVGAYAKLVPPSAENATSSVTFANEINE